MFKLDLKVQCPELLHQIPGFPNDGTGTALPSIINEARTNQKDLRQMFGFSIDDDATIEEEITELDTDKFKWSTKIILSLLSEEQEEEVRKNMKELQNNALASGMKISKAIAKRVVTNEHIPRLLQCLTSLDSNERDYLMENIRDELEKYTEDDIFMLCSNPMVFVQNFFSEVANTKNRYIGFTLEPLMFVRGCNSESFTSCYKIDRWYNSNAPFTLARSGLAGMMYIRNNKEILGRCWVVIAPDFKSVCILKPYGFLDVDTQERLIQWVCAGLNSTIVWKKARVNTELDASFNRTGVYDDPIKFAVTCDAYNVNYGIQVPKGKCILCGSVLTMNSSTCICDTCQNERFSNCVCCGNRMLKDMKHKVQVCEQCLKQNVICPDCGRVHSRDKECVCKFNSDVCMFCGDKKVLTINGVSLCNDCATSMCKTQCDICGSHGVMYPMKKLALCQRCFTIAQRPSIIDNQADEFKRRIKTLVEGEQHD